MAENVKEVSTAPNFAKKALEFLSPPEDQQGELLDNLSFGDKSLDVEFWKWLGGKGRETLATISSVVFSPLGLITGFPMLYMALQDLAKYPNRRAEALQGRRNLIISEINARRRKEQLLKEIKRFEEMIVQLSNELLDPTITPDHQFLRELIDLENGSLLQAFVEMRILFGPSGVDASEAKAKYLAYLHEVKSWNSDDLRQGRHLETLFQRLFGDAQGESYIFLDSKLKPLLQAVAARLIAIPKQNNEDLQRAVDELIDVDLDIETLTPIELDQLNENLEQLDSIYISVAGEKYVNRGNLTPFEQSIYDIQKERIRQTRVEVRRRLANP